MTVEYTTWDDPESLAFRGMLDDEMHARYTGRHDDDPDFALKAEAAFAVDAVTVVAVVLVRDGTGSVVGHAALRRLPGARRAQSLEVKKVVVAAAARGAGVGRRVMGAVEDAAREHDARALVLQTGDRQPDAVALYESLGYRRIPTFDPYLPITNSICFEKVLDPVGSEPD